MEKLEQYDGFWRDSVSKESKQEKIKYLNDLIRNQNGNLKNRGMITQEKKQFHKKVIELAQSEKKKLNTE